MITLETIVQELQQVPPEHLEEVHRLIQRLLPHAMPNELLAAKMREILTGPDNLSEQEWNEINGHMRQLRAELFTRPNPFFADEADAA